MSSLISSELKLSTRRYQTDEKFKNLVNFWTEQIKENEIPISDFEQASKFTIESVRREWKNG